MNKQYRQLAVLLGVCIALPALAQEGGNSGQTVSPADTAPSGAGGETVMRLTVIDPYAELRSGPGRGYPVFYAVEQGETIEVLSERPGWYEVRAENGRTGWTSTKELSRTMQASGVPADLPTVSFGDYLKQNWLVGLKSGRFSQGEMDGSDTFTITAGYKFLSWLGVEAELGKVFGNDVRGNIYGANVVIEPLSRWRISPFVSFGVGTMDIDSQPKLVPLNIEESDYENYNAGANYYLGRNFVVNITYRWYNVDTDINTERLEAWNIGFNAFF